MRRVTHEKPSQCQRCGSYRIAERVKKTMTILNMTTPIVKRYTCQCCAAVVADWELGEYKLYN